MRTNSRPNTMLAALAAAMIAVFGIGCDSDSLEDETNEVLEEQREASRVADEFPGDTALQREAAEDVIEEQREAAAALRKEVKEKLDTTATRQ